MFYCLLFRWFLTTTRSTQQTHMAGMKELVHVMTDAVGQYNKVVLVSQYERFKAYKQNFQKNMDHSEKMKKMKEIMEGYQDMYLTGSREIYQ